MLKIGYLWIVVQIDLDLIISIKIQSLSRVTMWRSCLTRAFKMILGLPKFTTTDSSIDKEKGRCLFTQRTCHFYNILLDLLFVLLCSNYFAFQYHVSTGNFYSCLIIFVHLTTKSRFGKRQSTSLF